MKNGAIGALALAAGDAFARGGTNSTGGLWPLGVIVIVGGLWWIFYGS